MFAEPRPSPSTQECLIILCADDSSFWEIEGLEPHPIWKFPGWSTRDLCVARFSKIRQGLACGSLSTLLFPGSHNAWSSLFAVRMSALSLYNMCAVPYLTSQQRTIAHYALATICTPSRAALLCLSRKGKRHLAGLIYGLSNKQLPVLGHPT